MLPTIMLLLTLFATMQGARPTIVAKPSDPPDRNVSIIYYDDAFLFAGRNYGSASVGGNTEPGLFVHSKAQSRWIQIMAISTADGTFGKSPFKSPEGFHSPVSWDFAAAGRQPYIGQPLRTSGSIAFPGVIEYSSDTDRYVLRYFSNWGPGAEVVLYVARGDLRVAFARSERIAAKSRLTSEWSRRGASGEAARLIRRR